MNNPYTQNSIEMKIRRLQDARLQLVGAISKLRQDPTDSIAQNIIAWQTRIIPDIEADIKSDPEYATHAAILARTNLDGNVRAALADAQVAANAAGNGNLSSLLGDLLGNP